MKGLLLSLSFVLLLAGCCGDKYCECSPSTYLKISYRKASGECVSSSNSDLHVRSFYRNGGGFVADVPWIPIGSCDNWLEVTDANSLYWIVASDSLSLSDTLRVDDVKTGVTANCCKCPAFERITWRLNSDVITNQNVFTRVVP